MENMKKDFTIFENNPGFVYLDSTATAQRPKQVVDAVTNYYNSFNSNVHRGIYKISEQATAAYEGSRVKVKEFINASSEKEVIFTSGATQALNTIAYSLGQRFSKGDKIITTIMEHHSNIVPWQMLRDTKGIILEFVDITEDGSLDLADLEKKLDDSTKLVSITHASNVLGTINSVQAIANLVHDAGALFAVDAAQSVPHMSVDVQKIDCDFLVFSGHKMLGPTGTGVLYGKEHLLEEMPPFMYGGDMIRSVSLEKTEFNILPHKFEAGTPNVAGVIGLGAAVDYLTAIGMDKVRKHEQALVNYAKDKLNIDGVKVYGPEEKGAIFAFSVEGVHPHDVAQILDSQNIAIRAGHHCAMPLMNHLGVTALARASAYVYTDEKDIDALANGIKKAKEVFA